MIEPQGANAGSAEETAGGGLRFFRLTVSYDGTLFAGWQWQTNHRSVQATMEQALATVTGQQVRVVASGRTDAGVHAVGQGVSFCCETRLDANSIRRALNHNLPDDIVVLEACDAPFGFHATRDALKKRYRYVIQDGPVRDLFARPYAWWIRKRLDAEAMHRAAQRLVGRHNFKSFQSTGSSRIHTERTIFALSVERRRIDMSDRIIIEVEADGFLYNMVRNIAGTLVAVGKGKRPESWVSDVLAAQDRRAAGEAAPPQGLYFLQVWFEEDVAE